LLIGRPQAQWTLSRFLITVGLLLMSGWLIRESPLLQQRGAMVLLLGVVALATWFGGSVNGLVALAGSVVISTILLFMPTGSLQVNDTEDWFRVGMFLLIGLLLIGFHQERVVAQLQMQRSSQRLSFALRSASVGLIESNLRSGDFWWSDNLPSMVGRDARTFAREYNQFFEYVHPGDQDRLNRAFTTMVEEGGMPTLQFRVKSDDGHFVSVHIRMCVLFDESGTPDRVVAVVQPSETRAAG